MEQIWILVLIALVWLVQLIVRWLQSRGARVPGGEAVFVRGPRRAPTPESPPVLTGRLARLVGPPRRQRTTLGTRRELRRAIVLREVLGPCRAMDSNEK